MRRQQARHVTRTIVAAALVWLLWVANAISDLLHRGGLSPLTLAMLAGLVGGHVAVWLGVVPNPMPPRWALVTYMIVAIIIAALGVYSLTRLMWSG